MASRDKVAKMLEGKLDADQLDRLLAGDGAEFPRGDRTPVGLELTDGDNLVLYAFLGAAPIEDALARPYLIRVLELNQPGFLQNARLAVHDNEVVAQTEIDSDQTDAAAFAAAFASFANQADALAEHLRGYLEELAREPVAGNDDPPAAVTAEPIKFKQGWVQA